MTRDINGEPDEVAVKFEYTRSPSAFRPSEPEPIIAYYSTSSPHNSKRWSGTSLFHLRPKRPYQRYRFPSTDYLEGKTFIETPSGHRVLGRISDFSPSFVPIVAKHGVRQNYTL